jgi:excisionase family DNA binding protein
LAAFLAEIQDDDDAKRELAEVLRPYLIAPQKSPGTDRLLDATEKAAQLRLHPDTLVKMARDHRIWATKVGRQWRFRSGDLPKSRFRRESHGNVAADARQRRQSSVAASVAAIRG